MGAAALLSEALLPFEQKIELALLYGSVAKTLGAVNVGVRIQF